MGRAHKLERAEADTLPSSVESLLPKGLAEETLTSLALLFPSSSGSEETSWLGRYVASDPEHDSFLHAIRTSHLEPYERDIPNFHYWRDRIVTLQRAVDEPPYTHSVARFGTFDEPPDTHSVVRWQHNRRIVWIVSLFGTLSLCLGIAQLVIITKRSGNYTIPLAIIAGVAVIMSALLSVIMIVMFRMRRTKERAGPKGLISC